MYYLRLVIVLLFVFFPAICFSTIAQWEGYSTDQANGYILYFKNTITQVEYKIVIPDNTITSYEFALDFSQYEISMTAFNDYGESDRSNTIFFRRTIFNPGVSDILPVVMTRPTQAPIISVY